MKHNTKICYIFETICFFDPFFRDIYAKTCNLFENQIKQEAINQFPATPA